MRGDVLRDRGAPVPPFDGGAVFVFGGFAALLCPLGQVVASALLPRAGTPAPALRRLDSLLLLGPAWPFLVGCGDRCFSRECVTVGAGRVHPGAAPRRAPVAAQAVRDGRDLQPLPEPDRAGAAQAVGRDPPADRPGPRDLGSRPSTSGPASSRSDDDGRPGGRDPSGSVAHRGAEEDPDPDLRVVPPRERRPPTGATGRDDPGIPPSADGLPARAQPGRPLPPHVAPRPAGVGRQRRHERLRARAGVRRWPRPASPATSTCGRGDDLPDVVDVEPGFQVVHVDAGPTDLAKEDLPGVVDEFTERRARPRHPTGDIDAIHANYWLSGVAGHRLKHELDLPLVSTFHTLARVKAETGDPEPAPAVEAESEVIGCSDAILAYCEAEAASSSASTAPTRAHRDRAAGVDHAFFSPGDQGGAALALDLGDRPVLLFVGRIQPLKGLDVAVAALAALPRDAGARRRRRSQRPPARRRGRRVARARSPTRRRRTASGSCRPAPPPALHLLPGRRRVPRAEPVGVLRAGRPRGRGLRHARRRRRGGRAATLVDHGRTGLLVEGRDPAAFAPAVDRAARRPGPGRRGRAPPPPSRGYTWSTAAARLRRIYGDLTARGARGVRRLMAARRGRRRPRRASAPADDPGRGRPTSSTSSRGGSTGGWPSSWRPNPVVAAVDRDEPGERRWFVRLPGEEKDTFTIWFTCASGRCTTRPT